MDVTPFQDTVELTLMKNQPHNTQVNVNVAAVIAQKYKDDKDTSDKVVIVLRDDDTSIKLLLYDAAGTTFKGKVGDVVVFENATCKGYGACYLINGTNAHYTLNPKGDHLQYLYSIKLDSPTINNLFPDKKPATRTRSLDSLIEKKHATRNHSRAN